MQGQRAQQAVSRLVEDHGLPAQVEPQTPVLLRHGRGEEPGVAGGLLQAAAFAYLSDWWINFTSVGMHVPQMLRDGVRLHVASLNHAIWLHRPLVPHDWMHVETHSPSACGGRALSIARVHDALGRLVASATQESLMAFAD